jgi:hypothetical protein
MGFADRGKEAEKKVKTFLQAVSERIAAFNYERLPDARSAGGRFPAVICDFLVQFRGTLYLLEVKQTERDYRLAYDKVDQLPKLMMWELSGSIGIVMVYHSTIKKWRIMFADELSERQVDGTASWDLREFELYNSVHEALDARLPEWGLS